MEVRCYLDLDEMQISGLRSEIQLGQRRNVNLGAWVERRQKSRDLDGVETGPGLSWDAHLETWIGLYGSRMELRYNSPVEKGPGWRWDTHLETCMGLRWCLDGTKMQFSGPGGRWDVTWMQVRCKYQDPDGGKIQLRQRKNMNLGAWVEMRHKSRDLDGVEMGPGLSWDTHLETSMGWYGTGMELRYIFPVEKGPGWKWYTNHRYMLHRSHSIQWVNLTICNWSDSKIFIEYICGKHHWFLYYTFASLNINTSLWNPCTLNNIKQ